MILQLENTPLNRIKLALTPPMPINYKDYILNKNKYKKEMILTPSIIYSPNKISR